MWLPSRLIRCSVVLLAAAWCACGSGSSSTGTTTTTGTNSGGTSPLTTPQVINVSAGANTSGTDITVPGSASSFNVEMLGVNSPSATKGSASNVGGAVARGSSALILIFGKGLTGSETLTFSGPNDIAISGQAAVKATDGTPGIQFTITVAGNAAVGARTLNVTSSSGNASTFVGGLEVF